MIDYEAAGKELNRLVDEGKLAPTGKFLEWDWSRRIVDAALGVASLFSWCPDCYGEGIIWTMSAGPDLDESSYSCGRCTDLQGMVRVWPEDDLDATPKN